MKIISILAIFLALPVVDAKWSGPYKESPAILESLKRKFESEAKNMTLPSTYKTGCGLLNGSNKPLLGDYLEETGHPAMTAPNPSFWQWYFDCARNIIDVNIVSTKSDLTLLVGKKSVEYFKSIGKEPLWINLPSEVQKQSIEHLVDHLLWRESLEEQGLVFEVYAQQILEKTNKQAQDKNLSLREALQFSSLLILTNHAFFLR